MADPIVLSGVTYRSNQRPLFVDLNFSVGQGQTLAIAGQSGSGKTTLLELCVGLRKPDSGSVLIDGQDITHLPFSQLLEVRQKIGFVFQDHALIHNYTMYDNIALPLRYHMDFSEREVAKKVGALLQRLNLLDCSHKLPEMLSVGQLKCASLARALIMDPQIVFLDEPTSSLDPVTAGVIVETLCELQMLRKITMVIISHNIFIMKKLSAQIRILDHGKLYGLDDYQKDAAPPVPEIAAYIRGAL